MDRKFHDCLWRGSPLSGIIIVAAVGAFNPGTQRTWEGSSGWTAVVMTCALAVVLAVLRRWDDTVYESMRRWRLDRSERLRAHVWVFMTEPLLLAGYTVLSGTAIYGRDIPTISAMIAMFVLVGDGMRHRSDNPGWSAIPVRWLYPAHAAAVRRLDGSDYTTVAEWTDANRADLDALAEYHPLLRIIFPSLHAAAPEGGERKEREELHQWVTSL